MYELKFEGSFASIFKDGVPLEMLQSLYCESSLEQMQLQELVDTANAALNVPAIAEAPVQACKRCERGIVREIMPGFEITQQEAIDSGFPELAGTNIQRAEVIVKCLCCEGNFTACPRCASGMPLEESSVDLVLRNLANDMKGVQLARQAYTHVFEADESLKDEEREAPEHDQE